MTTKPSALACLLAQLLRPRLADELRALRQRILYDLASVPLRDLPPVSLDCARQAVSNTSAKQIAAVMQGFEPPTCEDLRTVVERALQHLPVEPAAAAQLAAVEAELVRADVPSHASTLEQSRLRTLGERVAELRDRAAKWRQEVRVHEADVARLSNQLTGAREYQDQLRARVTELESTLHKHLAKLLRRRWWRRAWAWLTAPFRAQRPEVR